MSEHKYTFTPTWGEIATVAIWAAALILMGVWR